MRIVLSLIAGIVLWVIYPELRPREKQQDRQPNSIPVGYFRAPIDGELRLSGTFGELRSDHFHTGIDLRPNSGKSGQPVFAAADGYVERIKVEASGYGKALYIQHPNGHSTVYAHLERFTDSLEQYVKTEQYRKQRFGIDLKPAKAAFAVRQGEIIGYLGNSGSSSGPHLHFEIRQGETPVNPLLAGIVVDDYLPPKFHQLKIYYLNDRLETTGSQTVELVKTADGYGIDGDVLEVGAWRVAFGIKAYDHMPGTTSWLGLYGLDLRRNDSLVFHFGFDRLEFSESRYLNAHLDYQEHVLRRSNFNRCFLLPGNQLSIYSDRSNAGITSLFKDRAQQIECIARDARGNAAKLKFLIRRSEVSPAVSPTFNYVVPFDADFTISMDDLQVSFPKGTFYENCPLHYGLSEPDSARQFTPTHQLHFFTTPVHHFFSLSLKPARPVPSHQLSKAFVAYRGKDDKLFTCGGEWEQGSLLASVRALGDYSIMVDDVPPSIEVVSFGPDMRDCRQMSFKAKDNLPATGKARGLRFRATVDGRWILMEHDLKENLLFHKFDGRIGTGAHLLRLEVWDDRDNMSVFEGKFSR